MEIKGEKVMEYEGKVISVVPLTYGELENAENISWDKEKNEMDRRKLTHYLLLAGVRINDNKVSEEDLRALPWRIVRKCGKIIDKDMAEDDTNPDPF